MNHKDVIVASWLSLVVALPAATQDRPVPDPVAQPSQGDAATQQAGPDAVARQGNGEAAPASGMDEDAGSLPPQRIAEIESAVRRVLEIQQAAWNRGDIRFFMQGYARSPDLRFLSGAEIRRGWEDTLLRYLDRYGDRGAMGRLVFSDLAIQVLSAQHAMVHGRWMLVRQSDRPNGLFTLIFQNGAEGWRIVHDHTSSAPAAE